MSKNHERMKNNNETLLEVILHRGSSRELVTAYFNKVAELAQTGEGFPVDLDDVWPIVYNKKQDAVIALQSFGVQNIDYQCLRNYRKSNVFENQNFTNAGGNRREKKYKLSVSFFEYFIARKVKPVFEVYRKVFHLVRTQDPFFGVPFKDYNGEKVYLYRAFLKKSGMSCKSGSFWRRVRKYPNNFVRIDEELYIRGSYALSLFHYNQFMGLNIKSKELPALSEAFVNRRQLKLWEGATNEQ